MNSINLNQNMPFGHQEQMELVSLHTMLRYKMMEICVFMMELENQFGQVILGIKEKLHMN